MNISNNINELFGFIENSPTAYQAVETLRNTLAEQGFTELLEHQAWDIAAGGKYFVTRGGSSILAFKTPANTNAANGYQIMATRFRIVKML